MANAKISNDSVFVPATNVRTIDGLAGYDGSTNVKITGPALVTSVINSNNSGAEGRIPFYGVGADNFGGSSGLTWTQSTDTLAIGTPGGASGLNADLQLSGNYIAGSDQPELNFKFGDTTNSPSTFKITTQATGNDQTWLLPTSLPTAGQILSAEPNGSEVTLDWVDDNANTPNNNTITLAAGTGLTGGGDFTLNQNSNETITFNASASGGIDFSGLNIATIKADLTQSSQTQYGSAITVTAGSAISNGEIVMWDYSNGTVRSIPPSSLPQQNQIIGVAIQDIASGSDGLVLIYGYATVKSNYSATGDNFLNETNTINISNSDGVTTTLPTTTNDYLTFKETSTGNNVESSSVFDAGAGNTVKMKIIDFDLESTVDRMQIVVGSSVGSLSAATLSPGITGTSGAASNNGWKIYPNFFTSGTDDNGPNASGNAFPTDPGITSGGQTGPEQDSIWDLGARFAQFDFKSDGSVASDFELHLSSSLAVNITDSTPGAGMYLDGTDFEKGTNNNSTNRFIGTAAGGSFDDDALVILVAPPRV